ncbi:MAG TPA: iron-sulfur cluster carrier protein ApbC, partial [Mizugakiibacter sp.]|nr:iron-sulfur cluster carrier protein ApbC [Mizugakiibacter sp.]
ELAYPANGAHAALTQEMANELLVEPDIDTVSISLQHRILAHQVQNGLNPLLGVKNIIAVASGKGGVGKSTIAANLALALQVEGARVGLLDADIYGPSQQRMLGLEGKPGTPDGKHFTPLQAHGLQAMSIGVLIGEDTPMIWRGPMVTQTLQQLLNGTVWDNLDYLIVDLPPGTGDIQLTLAQRVPVAGAVIVTPPQDLALLDARRALQMFAKVKVPVLGIIENMATHICSACGHEEDIFGSGGGERMSRDYEVPLLGSLPLDIRIREQADQGCPTVVAEPESELALRYREIARRTAAQLALQARNKRIAFPKIVVRDD